MDAVNPAAARFISNARANDPRGLGSKPINSLEVRFGRHRFAGFREREIFYVLWIDTKLTLYNHGS